LPVVGGGGTSGHGHGQTAGGWASQAANKIAIKNSKFFIEL